MKHTTMTIDIPRRLAAYVLLLDAEGEAKRYDASPIRGGGPMNRNYYQLAFQIPEGHSIRVVLLNADGNDDGFEDVFDARDAGTWRLDAALEWEKQKGEDEE